MSVYSFLLFSLEQLNIPQNITYLFVSTYSTNHNEKKKSCNNWGSEHLEWIKAEVWFTTQLCHIV